MKHCWVLPLFLACVAAYGTGAPDRVCDSMTPGHGQSTNRFTDPFIVTTRVSTYTPLQKITVVVRPRQRDIYIRGYLIQARPAQNPDTFNRTGHFIADYQSRIACNGAAITHRFSADRGLVEVQWVAPSQPTLGGITFRVTVVRQYKDFYERIYSPVIHQQVVTTTPAPTTTTTTIATTPTTTTPTTTTTTTTTPPTTTSTPATRPASTTAQVTSSGVTTSSTTKSSTTKHEQTGNGSLVAARGRKNQSDSASALVSSLILVLVIRLDLFGTQPH